MWCGFCRARRVSGPTQPRYGPRRHTLGALFARRTDSPYRLPLTMVLAEKILTAVERGEVKTRWCDVADSVLGGEAEGEWDPVSGAWSRDVAGER